jgi:hypothetical protein
VYPESNYQDRILEIVARLGENEKHAIRELIVKLAAETRKCQQCKTTIAKVALLNRTGRKAWYWLNFDGTDHRATCPSTMATFAQEPKRVGRPAKVEQQMLL